MDPSLIARDGALLDVDKTSYWHCLACFYYFLLECLRGWFLYFYSKGSVSKQSLDIRNDSFAFLCIQRNTHHKQVITHERKIQSTECDAMKDSSTKIRSTLSRVTCGTVSSFLASTGSSADRPSPLYSREYITNKL